MSPRRLSIGYDIPLLFAAPNTTSGWQKQKKKERINIMRMFPLIIFIRNETVINGSIYNTIRS